MMYDRDNSGNVSVDETMHMLYARYGKDRLEVRAGAGRAAPRRRGHIAAAQEEMRALFGPDLKTQEGDGSLSFTEYLKARGGAPRRRRARACMRWLTRARRAQAVSVNPRGPAAGKAATAAKARKGGARK